MRHHTLHAPAAGIRLAWPAGTTIVIDPGPDEHTRTRNLAREHYLVALGVALSAVGLVLLIRSEPSSRSWLAAAGLLLGALVCHTLRPQQRTVPPTLVDLLEPLRGVVPTESAVIQRLTWEAAGLTAATGNADTPSRPTCARRLAQITNELRERTSPVMPSSHS